MLVLSRKASETVVIGEHVTVMVVEIRGNKVRLGIQAPDGVPIHRGELLLKHPDIAARHEEPAPVEQDAA